jgi:two-component system chemotaxis sensor kinase CheA
MIKATILLINDNPSFRSFLHLILEVAGYHILTTNEVEDALDMLREQPVQLIILADLCQSELAGYQLLYQVEQHPLWSTIPVICITGRALNREMNAIRQFGFDRYLTKPIQTWELLSAVHHHILPA